MQSAPLTNPSSKPGSAPACRTDFAAFRAITTRWMDNDVFGHVNNVTYYSFFDTAVTGWLVERGLIGLVDGPMWMVAETGCRFLSEIAFPSPVSVGLRVASLGRSSVRYEFGAFKGDGQAASAEGHFVHVYVDRATRRPTPMPDLVRAQLAALQITQAHEQEKA